MSDPSPTTAPAVSLRGLGKTYRLYQRPAYRLLDLFGLCPAGAGYYTEHAAVQDVTLDIARGEKVAIIGRNGAGKSTLLKIITHTLRPTAGTVHINGTVSALLQIGTGFHPDFTGRQNIYSGFAHAGITGARADALFDEVVDFSELEEYIDQPMKTYSTGMGARLMFSAATVLTPDIFVIDELLGVGDAYFAHKSYDRMRHLCANLGTTLLLVTHDIYAAQKLCNRFIWIDRGRVRMDADGNTTITGYEASVKEQEEERLRRRNTALIRQERDAPEVLNVRIGSRTGFALPAPAALARLELTFAGGERRSLSIVDESPHWQLLPEGNLGPVTTVAERACRCLEALGSIYHKAEWTVISPADAAPETLELDLHYEGDERLEVRVLTSDGRTLLRRAVPGATGWRRLALPLGVSDADEDSRARQGEHGTGLIRIEEVVFLDREGTPITRCPHGGALLVEARCRIAGVLEDRGVTFVLGFHRGGTEQGTYVHEESLVVPQGDTFLVRARLDPLLLGAGDWFVTIGLGSAGLYRQDYNPFFSLNDRWHHMQTRAYELHVESSESIDRFAVIVHPARIELSAATRVEAVASTQDSEPSNAASN